MTHAMEGDATGSPIQTTSRSAPLIGALLVLAIVAAAQAFGVLTSPPDRDMGHLQKIMYVHVPAAWNAFLAFVVVLFGSVMYLWKREEKWDLLAAFDIVFLAATFMTFDYVIGE